MEEEIDLMDYIKVIIKRWKMILCIFLIIIFIGASVSFTMPKTFQAQAVVKIGNAESKVLENITETIEILKGKFPGVTLSNPSGTSLINIKALGETPQGALDGVNNTVDVLLSQHQKIYNEAKLLLEEGIINIQKDITNTEQKIVWTETKIEEVDLDIQKQEAEIKEIEIKIQKEEATSSQARALIIQGYLSRLTVEENRKETFRNKKEQLMVDKQELDESKQTLEEKLKAKELAKELNFEPTQVEISAVLPQNPIEPNIKLNILVAAVLGLFVGVLLAFGLEWWEKENKIKLA